MDCQQRANGNWEDKAKEAFEAYLEDLKASLPPDASIADIERALLKHSPQMMSETFQALAERQDFPPSEAKGET